MKAIRLHIKQNSANYRREETVNCRMTYPLPPYSTVIGALHKACGYTEYHPMKLSIQGNYCSLKRRLFREDVFLDNLQNDRGWLVKMSNPDMLSSAYEVAAIALKPQGNDFEKDITVRTVNRQLIEEYRFLKRRRKRFDRHRDNVVKKYSEKLKAMKADSNVSKEELNSFAKKEKAVKSAFNMLVKQKFDIPYSYFKTLSKVPKYYELLCDVELIIHITSDESTLKDIADNICNLTAIGRGEDFVEVLECEETELAAIPSNGAASDGIHIYVPSECIDNALVRTGKTEGLPLHGTKYLLNKDYCVDDGKRIFNRISVVYTDKITVYDNCEDVFVDVIDNKERLVFLV